MRQKYSLSSAGATSIEPNTPTNDAVKCIYSDILGVEWRIEGEQKYPHLMQVCERVFRHVRRSSTGSHAYHSRVDAMKKVTNHMLRALTM